MRLWTPSITGPLCVWMSRLRIEGSLPGATILVSSIGPNPRMVGKSVASGAIRERIELLPGVVLQPDDRLVARQELGGENSEWTADILAVPVAAAPADADMLPALSFSSRLYHCGQRVVISGAVPGAFVSVSGPSGVIAEGIADEDGTRLDLVANYPTPGILVAVQQTAPAGWPSMAGTSKVTSMPVLPLPVRRPDRLPPPTVEGSLPKGCDNTLAIKGIFDGAVVVVTRASSGISASAPVGKDRTTFSLSPPIDVAGDRLAISQVMPRCEIDGLLAEVDCPPAVAPSPPVIDPPCPGSTLISLSGLNRGSKVILTVNGDEYLGVAPRDKTQCPVGVAPVSPDAIVRATQERCGLPSAASEVRAAGLLVSGPPDVAEPLYQCARIVRVTSATTGAFVRIWMRGPNWFGPISNIFTAPSSSFTVRVTPFLQANHELWVEQLACGGPWLQSATKRVVAAPAVTAPTISTSPIDGSRQVYVDAIPGAFVEVFDRRGVLLGAGDIDPLFRAVWVDSPLREGDLLHARQTLCNSVSEFSPSVAVLAGERVFNLTDELTWPSPVDLDEEVVCERASMVCRHNGSWTLTAFFRNKAEEADAQIAFDFKLTPAPTPPFGATTDVDLSAAGDGRVTRIGFRTLGIPSEKEVVRSGAFPAFRDPIYWATQILSAGGSFAMIVAWQTYPELETEDNDEEGD